MNKIFVYTHTHWDREWYQPFETFRTYLLGVLKRVLDEMEAGKLTRFYLDGQAILLEDALELAPELGPRVKALMEKGELAAGPWYVLSDENLICGESLIRNLKLGISSIKRFGEPTMVGYCPDTFAHTQDLPRILSGFGINTAFVWRGVPPLSYGPVFWWQSPDNSQVLTYHLKRGYYQTGLHEADNARDGDVEGGSLQTVVDDIANFAADRGDWDNSTLYEKTPNQVLYPIGGDHVAPPRDFVALLEQLNVKLKKKDLELVPIHLSEFADMVDEKARANNTLVGLIRKELRDNSASAQNGNAYLLQGVLSTRLYLKRANREAERRLLRFAEPLFSMLALRNLSRYPASELLHATRLLMKNHPHDSICGCSVDVVHDEMEIRYERVHQVLDALLQNAEQDLSGMSERSSKSPRDPDAALKSIRILNPSGRSFTGPVRYQWHEKIAEKLVHDNKLVQIEKETAENALYSGWGRVPYYSNVKSFDGWIWVENLPPFGELNLTWPLCGKDASVCETEKTGQATAHAANKNPAAQASNELSPSLTPDKNSASQASHKNSTVMNVSKLHGKTLDNGILKVTADERGQLAVIWTAKKGKQSEYKLAFSFRDTADGGDTYNYDPVPQDRAIGSKLISVLPGKKGPLLSSLIFKHEIKIPDALLDDKLAGNGSDLMLFKRSSQLVTHEVETEVILRRGSRIVEFETKFDNRSVGHRLELMLSTGLPVHTTFSENHFSLARRYHQTKNEQKIKLPVPPGCEAPCDRFPSQRFVIVNGQIILNRGLPEYGVDGDNLTLTLLRSVERLSRGRMQTRGGGAGPHFHVPGAASLGANVCSYAWAPLEIAQKSKLLSDNLSDMNIAEAYDLAEQYEQQVFCAPSLRDDTASSSLIRCENPAIRFVSTYISEQHDTLFLRMLNVSNEPVGAHIRLDFEFSSAHLCKLDEEPEREVFLYRDYVKSDDQVDTEKEICSLEINFGVNELKTLKIRLRSDEPDKTARSASRTRRKKTSKVS